MILIGTIQKVFSLKVLDDVAFQAIYTRLSNSGYRILDMKSDNASYFLTAEGKRGDNNNAYSVLSYPSVTFRISKGQLTVCAANTKLFALLYYLIYLLMAFMLFRFFLPFIQGKTSEISSGVFIPFLFCLFAYLHSFGPPKSAYNEVINDINLTDIIQKNNTHSV